MVSTTLCRNFFTAASNNGYCFFQEGNPDVLKENFSFSRETFTIYKVRQLDEIENKTRAKKNHKELLGIKSIRVSSK